MQPTTILVVEDDATIRASLAAILGGAGYSVKIAADGRAALDMINPAHGGFDVVVSDIFLGDVDGIALLKAARALPDPPAVILFTGHSTVQSAVAALRAGAHDYLFKPYHPDELLASVERAVNQRRVEYERAAALRTIVDGLRRLESNVAAPSPARSLSQAGERLLQIGPITLDRYARTLTLDGQLLRLTPTEYQLLLALAEAGGSICTYRDLVQRIYGYDEPEERRARLLLKGHVHNLRLKLGQSLIVSVRGSGYKIGGE